MLWCLVLYRHTGLLRLLERHDVLGCVGHRELQTRHTRLLRLLVQAVLRSSTSAGRACHTPSSYKSTRMTVATPGRAAAHASGLRMGLGLNRLRQRQTHSLVFIGSIKAGKSA